MAGNPRLGLCSTCWDTLVVPTPHETPLSYTKPGYGQEGLAESGGDHLPTWLMLLFYVTFNWESIYIFTLLWATREAVCWGLARSGLPSVF